MSPQRLLSPPAVRLRAFHQPLLYFHTVRKKKIFIGQNGTQVNWKHDLARVEKHLYSFRALSSAPLNGPKGCIVTSYPVKFTQPTVHRLLFHNCGYFDGKMPLDERYSIPRWLLYPLYGFPCPPLLFLLSPYRRFLRFSLSPSYFSSE